MKVKFELEINANFLFAAASFLVALMDVLM